MRANRHDNRVIVHAPAKVNLFLEILHKRADGYHELVTFMTAVNLLDTLEFKEEPSGTTRLTIDVTGLSAGPDNLIWRAAELLRQQSGVATGVHIHLTKRIPLAAGLAGGSSDAAATLIGLDSLWNLNRSRADLAELAAKLGSDIPFFVLANAAWCTGRGEVIEPVELRQPLHLVIASPGVGLSTAAVFRTLVVPSEPVSANAMRTALESGDVLAIGAAQHNRLQSSAESLCPEVAAMRQAFASLNPCGHLMSGSGSSYFALCRDANEANELARRLVNLARGSGIEAGLRVFVVQTLGFKDEPSSIDA